MDVLLYFLLYKVEEASMVDIEHVKWNIRRGIRELENIRLQEVG